MSNLSDYVKDYYDRYPWFSAIFPNITHNGLNVSHRVGILRQACWVLKQILESNSNITEDGNTFITGAGGPPAAPAGVAGDLVNTNGFDKLTADDLSLLGIVLKQTDELLRGNTIITDLVVPPAPPIATAINDSRYENYINFLDRIENSQNRYSLLISKKKDPNYISIVTAAVNAVAGAADTPIVGAGAGATLTTVYNAIVGTGIAPAAAGQQCWIAINTAPGAAGGAYAGAGANAVGNSYLSNLTITPRLIGDYIGTYIFHTNRQTLAIGVANHGVPAMFSAVNNNICLRTLLFHFMGNDNLNIKIVNSLAKLACITSRQMGPPAALAVIPASFLISTPLPSKNHLLFDKTLADLLNYALSDRANFIGNSVSIAYLNSFKMYKDNIEPKESSDTYFLKTTTGGLVLMDGNNVYNYDNIITNDNFCSAFGANANDPGPGGVGNCAGLFDVCLRGDNTDKEACKAEFKKLTVTSKSLKAWIGKTPKQKQMLAYNVLNGLGFTALNKRGGLLTFSNLDDNEIYTRLGLDLNNQVDKEKVSYIRNLINLVGDIQLNVTKTQSALPLHVYNDTPLVNSFNPVLVYSPLYSGLAGGALIGGNPGYGVAQHALNDITNIRGILGRLNKTMAPNKIKEINEKLDNYYRLAKDIDIQRIVLDKYLIAKSVVNADDLVLTEQEALLISDKLAKDNEAFIKKSAKIDRLGYKLVAVMP